MKIRLLLVLLLISSGILICSDSQLRHRKWRSPNPAELAAQEFNDVAYETMEMVGGTIGGAATCGTIGAAIPLALSCLIPPLGHPVIVGGSAVSAAVLGASYGGRIALEEARKVYDKTE
jgi:hypothetical protein